MSGVHLIFHCAGSPFAVSIEQVIEVVRMVAPTAKLPRAPRYCLGAIDYHGQLVPLLDLGARLGLCPPHPINELVEARVILVSDKHEGSSEGLLGYMVDEVSELSDRPISKLAHETHRFGGLVLGSLRWREGTGALVLDLRTGVLLPHLAGAEIRRAIFELQALAESESKP